MPQTVSGSIEKVANSFMAWVGGISQATGATDALSGGLDGLASTLDSLTSSAVTGVLNDVADNMSTITTVAGALVGVGLARYLGGIVTSATGATTSLIAAAKSEVALAVAQNKAAQSSVAAARADVYRAQQALQHARSLDVQAAQQERVAAAEAKVTAAQARLTAAQASGTATEKVKARSALDRAQAALVAAKSTDVQAVAERRLAAAQAGLKNNIANRVTAQNNLNGVTSVGTRLLGGTMGLIGGIPGLVMLGAGAWYAMYQNQEQARQSAQEYAKTIDEVSKKTRGMSLPEVEDNRGKTVQALVEQNRLIEEQERAVSAVKKQIDDLNKARGQPGMTNDNDLNIVKSLGILTDQLTIEEDKLNQMREKSRSVQQALEAIERRRNDLIREQAWRQNAAYQSLLMMNGQHSEFNRLLSLGNQLIASRNSMASVPFAIPQVPVSDKDQQALLAEQQQAELAGLTGLARVRRQADFDLQKMGRTGPENSTYAAQYRKAVEDKYNRTQNLAEAQKASASATREAEKAERAAAQTAEQYSRKIADLSIATEVQKVRATQGEKAADLFAASHENGTRWTDEQRRAIEASAVELAKWTQAADEAVRKQREMEDALKNLNDATRKYQDAAALTRDTAGMGDRQRDLYGEQQEVWRVFDKTDKGAQAIAARDTALSSLEKKYQALAATESDWLSGASRGYENWLENTSDIAGTVASGVTSTLDSAMDNMSAMLVGSKANWKDWGLSVLQMISRVALQMAVVNAMGGGSSSTNWLGTIASGVAGYFGGGSAGAASASSGTALQNYGSTFQFNAKGGVYDSPSLSAYSNGVYNSPQLFAFAKGAGVFGEAGPEAIMPLTRAADGSLGVRAVGSGVNNAAGPGVAPQVHITIESNGNTQTQSSVGYEQFGRDVGNYIDRRYRELMGRDMAPGGAIWNLAKGAR